MNENKYKCKGCQEEYEKEHRLLLEEKKSGYYNSYGQEKEQRQIIENKIIECDNCKLKRRKNHTSIKKTKSNTYILYFLNIRDVDCKMIVTKNALMKLANNKETFDWIREPIFDMFEKGEL